MIIFPVLAVISAACLLLASAMLGVGWLALAWLSGIVLILSGIATLWLLFDGRGPY